ncbi:ATP-dependent Clp protease ATP-binding subunit ClpC [Spirochaetia bacterium]|nr:ATP-dependent Clp protease ATP-binding subunit ClpC [Spirochaetia bacterium]
MFRGLTLRAQRILTVEAQKEARRYHSGSLEPEHILLAIIIDGGGVAYKALEFLQVDIEQFRKTLESMILLEEAQTAQYGVFTSANLPPSRRTKLLIRNAAEESRIMDKDCIGTEHLLLAAFYEPHSCVHGIFGQQNADANMLRIVLQTNFRKRPENAEDNVVPGCFQPLMMGEPFGGGFSGWARTQSEIKSATSVLDEYSQDLTERARRGELDPVIGRGKEIERAVRILSRRSKNNPVLAGEPGTGKTAIAEGLAQYLISPDVPHSLRGKRLLSLDVGAIVAGTKYRGEFEERIKRIISETEKSRNIVLFIDEIHTIVGAGGAGGALDAGNMLKPALSRGIFQCVGATTLAEYRKYFEKDGALERRFQMILVQEPDVSTTELILNGLKPKYEEYHHVSYSPDAITAAARLAKRYISGRAMPDKAIDVLDEAAAMKKLTLKEAPAEVDLIERHITALEYDEKLMVAGGDFSKADDLIARAHELRHALESARMDWEREAGRGFNLVKEADVRTVVSEMAGIPVSRLEEAAAHKLNDMETSLHAGIVGQDEAVRRICDCVRRGKAGISRPERPLGTFLFMGPSGVGKTLLARRLAVYLFGSEDALFRIDMSDFMERHNASRLTGSPPGYVGYEEGGVLTERVRRNPYSIILFDEIEKAHRDVFNLLLPILEEGELKDNLGHTVDFRNSIIIMTSNAGTRELATVNRLGFTHNQNEPTYKDIEEAANKEAKRIFNPEFLNRLDDIVVFHQLDQKHLEQIYDMQLNDLRVRIASEHGYSLKLTKEARRIILEKSRDVKYGARAMRRVFQKDIEDKLSHLVLEFNPPAGTLFLARGENGKIIMEAAKL